MSRNRGIHKKNLWYVYRYYTILYMRLRGKYLNKCRKICINYYRTEHEYAGPN